MNIYEEAKSYFNELVDNIACDVLRKDELKNWSLNELIKEDDYKTGYEYSVYTGDLFEAIANNLNILSYAVDIEEECGTGIASSPMLINEAIYRYMIDEYGDEYFNN